MKNQDINQSTVVVACAIDLVTAVMRKLDTAGLNSKLVGTNANVQLQNSYVAAKINSAAQKRIGSH